MDNKTAIVLGATGLTGSLLLKELINNDDYASIKLFSRSSTPIKSSKIKEYIGDVLNLETFKSDFTGDVVFCCIGTTKAKTKDQEKYKAIDYGIPLKAAILAKENNINTIVIISAIGASAKSNIFYNRTKGEMEEAVLNENIPHTYILRPSLITGNRNEQRSLEKLGGYVFKVMDMFMIGSLKKYKSIKAETIVKAMVNLEKVKPEQQLIQSNEIKTFSN
jgi:uncharacterized protein YbjT (DUF2867 family)